MEKKLDKRKKLNRKYKHAAAALAGVAIMAGTAFHGIPNATAEAAVKKPLTPPVTNEQTTAVDKDTKNPVVESSRTATDPVVTQDRADKTKDDQRTDRDRGDRRDRGHYRYDHRQYEHERWADRGQAFDQRMNWYNDSSNKIQMYYNNASPIDIVKAASGTLGFNVNNDTFTMISQNGSQSIVRVVHNGTNYDITVDHLSNGNWQLTMVNVVR